MKYILTDSETYGEMVAAPTAQPTVEHLAQQLHTLNFRDIYECRFWADKALALLPGRTEAAVKAEALREAADGFWARLADGTGNGRAYNSWRVADILREMADRIEAKP